MSISLSELAGCYVVLWSPRHRIFQTETFSAMVDRNHTFFFRQARSVPDWIVVGVAHSAEAADRIHKRADRELSERRHPTPETDEQAAEAMTEMRKLDAYLAGRGPEPQYPPAPPPWWFSEK